MTDTILRTIRTASVAFFLSIIPAGYALAQPTTIRYGVENGLSSRNCNCVVQDPDGYIWIGTENGLDRFDGHHFHHHDIGEGAGNDVSSLWISDDGTLWVGTGMGLYTHDIKTGDTGKFEKETEWRVGIYSKVNVLKIVGTDHLFIGTDGQGFFIHNLSNGNFRQFNKHASMVSSIAEGQNGDVLIGSEEGTISEYDRDGYFIRTIFSNSGTSEPRWLDITSMMSEGDNLWVGLGNKGFCHIGANATPETIKPKDISGSFVVNCQAEGIGDELILGGRNGLFIFHTQDRSFERIPISDIMGERNVGSIFIDRDGGLWCTIVDNGLLYVSKEKPGFFRLMEDRNITAMSRNHDGSIWIGTLSGRLFKTDANGNNPVMVTDIFPDIRCIMVDSQDIWIGTLADGIYIYNTRTHKVVNHRYDRYNQSTISDNCVNCIFKDSSGRIYVGTEWGLCYYNRKNGAFRSEPRSANNSQILGFFQDSKSNVWIASEGNGMFRISTQGKGWEHFHLGRNPNMSSNIINCMAEDSKGRVWFGTSNGLCFYSYESKTFSRVFEEETLLSSRGIMSIESDNQGYFWVSTESEIICMDPSEDRIIGGMTKDDGLAYEQYSKQVSTTNGKMLLFGGSKGIDGFDSAIQRKVLAGNNGKRKVIITEVSVGGELVDFSSTLKLKHNTSDVTIHFSDMDYSHHENKDYSYKLEGLNDNWVDCGPSMTYSKVPRGRHRFYVKPADVPEAQKFLYGDSIELHVLPPFYLSVWAYLIYCMIAGMVAYLTVITVRKKQEKENYQDKYDFFTNITHEIRTPLTLIKTPLEKIMDSGDGTEETKHYLKIINKSADNLINLVNQLLDYRKNEDGHYVINKKPCNVGLVTEDIARRFQAAAGIEGKKLEIEVPEVSYTYEVDQAAYGKIIHNLLSNALKYADSLIQLKMTSMDDKFIVTVSNDGMKISQSEYEAIFKMFYQVNGSKAGTGIGLPLSRMLAQRHGGSLNVKSDNDLTTFELIIPGARAEIDMPVQTVVTSDEVLEPVENKKKSTILIVDDNVDLRHMVVEMLRNDYVILQAGDGKEAIGVLEKDAVDLILCDVMMPEMDGYQFCEYVKSEMRYANIPFIHITAKTDVEYKIKGFQYGADDFIEKPFSSSLLLSKVKSVLDNRARLMEFYKGLPIMHPAKVSKVTKSSADFIIKLKAELEKHISDENYSMSAMADSMFMSQSSFYRKVKTLTGVSPNEFVKDFRLQRAAEMLSTGEYLPNEVYLKVGFNSVPYFSLCFKKKYGVSPNQYVESLKKSSN